MTRTRVIRAALILAVVSLVVIGSGPALADPTAELSFDGDQDTPDAYGQGDLQVAKHPVSELTSGGIPQGIEDDSGEFITDTEWTANTTWDEESGDNANPITYDPALIEVDWYGEFPDKGDAETTDDEDNLASFLDASEWTTEQNAGNVTLSDTTVAQNVEAVRINVDKGGNNTNVVAEVAYGNWTSQLDSDESKRHVFVCGDVTQLDSSAVVQWNITDESGDYKQLLIDPDQNIDSGPDVMANATGTFCYQVGLEQLTTNGGGSWDNIEHVNMTVRHGSADVSISAFTLAKKGQVPLGIQRTTVDADGNDGDSDGEYDETQVVYNTTGTVDLRDLNGLDSSFDSAELTDVKFPVTVPGRLVNGPAGDDGDYWINWENADLYVGYDHVLNYSVRIVFNDYIDASWSNLELHIDQEWPAERYETLAIHEGMSGENFSDVSYTDKTGNLGSKGDENIDLDTSISTGTEYGVKVRLKLTDSERTNNIELSGSGDTDDGSDAAVSVGGGGGIVNMVTAGLAVGAAAVAFWWRKILAIFGLGG